MKRILRLVIVFTLCSFSLFAQNKPNLGAASPFTVLGKTGIRNSDNSRIGGKIGLYPGLLVQGLDLNLLAGVLEIGTPAASKAQQDLAKAYDHLEGLAPTQNLSGQDLKDKVLQPGVYRFDRDAVLSGNLTLDHGGKPAAPFIFQVNGDLHLEPWAAIALLEAAKPRIQNVFWQVKGRVTVGEGCTLLGSVLARQDITLAGSTQVQGRLLTSGGQVRLSGNQITFPSDLSVEMAKSPGHTSEDLYFIDEPITFTITARNLGPVDEAEVQVRSHLPAGVTFVQAQATSATYDPATATWTIPRFPNGATETLTLKGKINRQALDFLALSAIIAGRGLDELPANNSSFISSICVAPETPGTIQGPEKVCQGSGGNIFQVAPIPGVMTYAWMVPSGWTIESGHNTHAITVRAGNSPGTVSLAVQNVCSYSTASRKSVALTSPLAPAAAPISTSHAAPCAGTAGITYSIPPVAGADSYRWALPGDWQITAGQGSPQLTVTAGSQAGKVTVVAVNGCGEGPVRELAVAPLVNTLPAPAQILAQEPWCAGTTASLRVAEIPGASTYTWNVPAGWHIRSGQGSPAIRVEVGSSAGLVSVAASNACTTGPAASLSLRPGSLPAGPAAIAGETSVCAGNQVRYSTPEVSGASSYAWTVPAGWAITAGQGSPQITVTPGTHSGTVTVQATNDCGSSAPLALAVALQPGTPALPAPITGAQRLCGGTTGLVYSTPTEAGADVYTWELPSGWTILAGQGSNRIEVKAGTASGFIRVQSANACGQSPVRSLAVQPAAQLPLAVGPISGSTQVCAQTPALTYAAAAVAGADSYTWTVPAGWAITAGQGSPQITVTAGQTGGKVSVEARNACGTSAAQSLAVEVNTQLPAQPAAITGAVSVCQNQSELPYRIAPVAQATAYHWTVPSGWEILAGQGSTSITVKAGTAGGAITVAASNGCGQGGRQQVAVAIRYLPAQPAAISGPREPCAATAGLTYQIAPVAGATSYSWTVPEDWTITSGQGSPAITVIAGKTAGAISVVAANSCGQSPAASLEVHPFLPLPASLGPITAATPVFCQDQGQLTFSVPAQPGARHYHWLVPAGWTITSGQESAVITVKAGKSAGKITVRASNACGQTSTSELDVAPQPLQALTLGAISGSKAVCAGQANLEYAVAPIPGASTYTWALPAGWQITAGQGGPRITVTAGPGGGSVSVVAANNCVQAPAVAMEVDNQPLPAAPVGILNLSNPCEGLVFAIANQTDLSTGKPAAYTWTVPAGWTITEGQGSDRIRVTAKEKNSKGTVSVLASNGNCTSMAASLEADPAVAEAQIHIANALTANGDGYNDTWEIKNLLNYPDNELTIFNRWGNEVYRRKAYANDWNGDQLNAGTYFYQLKVKVCDGSYQAYKGYVMILREG
ncbi:MAG: ice-binding family protein [Adhaeribacter sp.]